MTLTKEQRNLVKSFLLTVGMAMGLAAFIAVIVWWPEIILVIAGALIFGLMWMSVHTQYYDD